MLYATGFFLYAIAVLVMIPLLALRMFGVIDLSYWIILSPIWIIILVVLGFILFGLIATAGMAGLMLLISMAL
jgi:hypothetical protein